MKKFTVTVMLQQKPETCAFNLNMAQAYPEDGLPHKRIFLANDIDYSINYVLSVTVNGMEIPEEFYVGKTRDKYGTGSVQPWCGFRIRDDVELHDFELVMRYVKS